MITRTQSLFCKIETDWHYLDQQNKKGFKCFLYTYLKGKYYKKRREHYWHKDNLYPLATNRLKSENQKFSSHENNEDISS